MRSVKNRHSWPQLRKSRYAFIDDPIDSDPFAYFVSPAEDRLVYIEGNLTAGIYTKRRSRSQPPLHSKRPRLQLAISVTSKSPTARLKRWIERMEKQYFYLSHRDTDAPDPIIKVIEPRSEVSAPTNEPIIIPVSPNGRGRQDTRAGSEHRRVGNNGRTPPRRRRVWREPSVEIWSVAEEDEEASLGLGIRL